MPLGHKKRKSAKRKNKASASPPQQGWLRLQMQMLKAPSLGNGTKDEEKHDMLEKEAAENGDREKGEEHNFFEFKGGETASASEMDALGGEGSPVSAIATAGIPSEAENSRKLDVLNILALDRSANGLQETEKSELFELNGFSEESVTSDVNVGWTGGLERKDREDKNTKEVGVGNSLEEVITSQVKEYVTATEVGELGQDTEKKEAVMVDHAIEASTCEKKNKGTKDARGSMEAPQDDEREATTVKTEETNEKFVPSRGDESSKSSEREKEIDGAPSRVIVKQVAEEMRRKGFIVCAILRTRVRDEADIPASKSDRRIRACLCSEAAIK